LSVSVYAGSFDPVTNGHLDIIERAAALFSTVIVAVGKDTEKHPMFSVEDRVEMLKETTQGMHNVEVDRFSGLLVDYVRKRGADAIVRGLRVLSDFEYEFEMALMNRKLAPELETVFLMARADHLLISSSLLKEIASLGGSVEGLVPKSVEERLLNAVREHGAGAG
jgi:pantetheine-phosphate adenylyltransferase